MSKKKKEERECCLTCIHRDYENYYGSSWVCVLKSCPWYAPWNGGNVREWRFCCKDYKRKTEFNLKYKEGDTVYIINKKAHKYKTPPITKHKIKSVTPTAIRCPYEIKLKDEEGTYSVYAREDELFSSYEEAKESAKVEFMKELDKIDLMNRLNRLEIVDALNYLDEYK